MPVLYEDGIFDLRFVPHFSPQIEPYIWPILPLGEHMSGMAYIMFTSPSFWFAFLLIPIITLFTDFTIKAIRVNFAPTPRELACLHERSKEKLSGKNVELAGYFFEFSLAVFLICY
ncbi:unnamed protein product [Gongylonema pulchrum]|uniref:DUF4149 domain-containing protein n=1 Tax=Gongylonema pulchrum TaxID=637853 RepID=A0A183EZR3_9BILA|nr:unnamed protein product [Gongylonema pulchrum]